MTENERREAAVNEAVRWLGAKEADGSFKPLIDAYNKISPLPRGYRMTYTDPWCADFVSAVGALVGLTAVLLPECSCDAMIAKYKAKGLYHEGAAYGAQRGDLVFYNWDGDKSSDHVGLVTSTTESFLRVIEGNKSDEVGYRVIAKDWRYIQGWASPDYAGEGDSLPEEQPDEGSDGEVTDAMARVPILARGDRGLSVRMLQSALIERGYDCGSYGKDGVFGGDTEAAVKAFQSDNGLEADGVCGPRTWEKLLGVTA